LLARGSACAGLHDFLIDAASRKSRTGRKFVLGPGHVSPENIQEALLRDCAWHLQKLREAHLAPGCMNFRVMLLRASAGPAGKRSRGRVSPENIQVVIVPVLRRMSCEARLAPGCMDFRVMLFRAIAGPAGNQSQGRAASVQKF
jgi:hypothetical protein